MLLLQSLEIDYTLCMWDWALTHVKGLSLLNRDFLSLSPFQEGKVHEEVPLQDAPFIL